MRKLSTVFALVALLVAAAPAAKPTRWVERSSLTKAKR
jgi:hypothetical protein